MMRVIARPDEFRTKIREKLSILFTEKDTSTSTSSTSTNGLTLSATAIENIEKSIYNHTVKIASERNIVKKWDNQYFVQLYIDRLRSIYLNTKEIILLLKEKKIKPHEIGKMTHQEMSPDKWQKMIEEKKIRDENKYAPKLEASTDNFTCRKCKSKECSYYQLQTRSADEPMTTFVTCLKCGSRWKC